MKFYTPMEWLKIDIANHFGLDKELFETRIKWTDDNHKALEKFREKADTPDRYSAAVMALRDVEIGNPTGHLVGLDACASGPQIMSALMRDPIGAENTNLIGNQRNDLYTKTTQAINKIVGSNKVYDRKIIKYVLMPFYYGSKAKPKEVFGEDTDELAAFYAAQELVAPGATAIMEILLNSWQPHALEHCWTMTDGFKVRVKVTQTKDTKIEIDELDHATFNYRHTVNEGKEEGLAMPANIIQSIDGFIVREMERRCNYNPTDLSQVRGLLHRRLRNRHSNGVQLDSIQEVWKDHKLTSLVDVEDLTWEDIKTFDFTYCEDLIKLIDRCLDRPSFPVISVHDEFQSHPNYVNWVRMTYMELLAEISESNIIDAILTEVTGKEVKVSKLAERIGHLIRQSEYALS